MDISGLDCNCWDTCQIRAVYCYFCFFVHKPSSGLPFSSFLHRLSILTFVFSFRSHQLLSPPLHPLLTLSSPFVALSFPSLYPVFLSPSHHPLLRSLSPLITICLPPTLSSLITLSFPFISFSFFSPPLFLPPTLPVSPHITLSCPLLSLSFPSLHPISPSLSFSFPSYHPLSPPRVPLFFSFYSFLLESLLLILLHLLPFIFKDNT